jgi:Glycine rich protein
LNRILKHIIFTSSFLLANLTFAQEKVTFDYTGKVQKYTIPDGVTEIKVTLFGAEGGLGRWDNAPHPGKFEGGKGGSLEASYPVNPGEVVYIFVGGKGENAKDSIQGIGGFNGGADGRNTGTYGPFCGGGGGGASDIRIGGSGLQNRVLIAGGGGGAGANFEDGADFGGEGGGLSGHNGWSGQIVEGSQGKGLLVDKDGKPIGVSNDPSAGLGGNQLDGGSGGQWMSYLRGERGKLGKGGTAADSTSGGGGGGGYYGGGGGSWSGGGGGSSFSEAQAIDPVHEQGVRKGNGQVVIEPACVTPDVALIGEVEICHGDEITLTGKSRYGATLSWDNNIKNGVAFMPFLGDNTYTMKSDNKKECDYTIDIKVKPGKPTIIASKTAVCEGEMVTLEVQDMTGVVWDNGITQGQAFAPPVGENKYKVTRKGECASEDEIIIKVNKIIIDASVTQINGNQKGEVDLLIDGGSSPYKYQWKDGNIEISIEKDLNNLEEGTYEVMVTDNIGCTEKASYTIEPAPAVIDELPPGPRLTAETSEDEPFVTVSYPGAFEYKIENDKNETVITGHSENTDVVDITRLPKGKYRVSLIYKQIKQYTTFVKN